MNNEVTKKNRKMSKKSLIVTISLLIVVVIILLFSVISPAIFSSRMLADIYPGNSYNRGIKADDYVPTIKPKDVAGEKAVALLREVHYTRTFRSHPVDWNCSNDYIPDTLKTNQPNEVKYIVYVNIYREKMGEYTNNSVGSRVDYYVHIIDRTNGEVIESQLFKGGAPPSTISSSQGGAVGSKPAESNIIEWVSNVLL